MKINLAKVDLANQLNSSNSKKGGKKKKAFRNAELAQSSAKLKVHWKELLAKYQVVPTKEPKSTKPLKPKPVYRRDADSPRIPSKSDSLGVGATKESQVYTGTKMIGIGQMHKSNAVPIFSSEDAVAIAKMRR